MPQIGETRKGQDIGYATRHQEFTWVACPQCGHERWRAFTPSIGSVLCRVCEINNRWPITKPKKYHGGPTYTLVRLYPPDPYYVMGSIRNKRCKRPCSHVPEHRLVMAKHLGRLLTRDEYVHYLNGDTLDNRIENLAIVTNSSHKTTFAAGLKEGFRIASQTRERELEKQIKLLQWQIKELQKQLTLRLKLEE